MIWDRIERLFKVDVYRLPMDKIKENLRIEDSATIEDIYQTCLRLLSDEYEQTSKIDGKATSLFGMIGVTITLVFSVGALVIGEICKMAPPVPKCIPWLATFYVLATFLEFVSIFMVLGSMRVRSDWRAISDKSLFRKDVIEKGNDFFRRYMITHMWRIYTNNYRINERKAKMLYLGQLFYFISIVFLFLMIIILTVCFSMF